MQIYLETAFQQIGSLVDFVGYSLMLALATIIWWGVNTGIEIRVGQAHGNSATQLADSEQVVSSARAKTVRSVDTSW